MDDNQYCCMGSLKGGPCTPSCKHAKPKQSLWAQFRAFWRDLYEWWGMRAEHDDTDPCCEFYWGGELNMGSCEVCRERH